MTKKIYLADLFQTTGRAYITSIASVEKPFVRLSQTIFHPQGGGQKSDRGTINGVPVIHAAHDEGGEVNHYLTSTDSFTVGEEIEYALDEEWRVLNSRYHSAGHLLAHVVEQVFPGLQAVAGHHWPGEARVEFFKNNLPLASDVEQSVQPVVNQLIAANLPVQISGDPFTNRHIRIGDFTAVCCGGTHVSQLSILKAIQIKARIKQQKLRVSYSL